MPLGACARRRQRRHPPQQVVDHGAGVVVELCKARVDIAPVEVGHDGFGRNVYPRSDRRHLELHRHLAQLLDAVGATAAARSIYDRAADS